MNTLRVLVLGSYGLSEVLSLFHILRAAIKESLKHHETFNTFLGFGAPAGSGSACPGVFLLRG